MKLEKGRFRLSAAVMLLLLAGRALEGQPTSPIRLSVPGAGSPPSSCGPSYCRLGDASDPDTLRAEISRDVDVLHYRIALAVDPATRRIRGTTLVRVASQRTALTTLDLHFRRLDILAVRLGGAPASFSRRAGVLTVELDRAYGVGEIFEVEVDSEGTPEDGFFFRSRVIYTRSQPDKARFWFPCQDVPSDKATCETVITVPSPLEVVSNGRLVSVTDEGGGQRTYHWSEQLPIATYLISLAIADYATFSESFRGVPVDFHVLPEQITAARADFAPVVDMMGFYSDLIVPYPFEKYAMAVAPLSGAMEHQTCTTFGESLVSGNGLHRGVIAHELAHSWFGNLVTLVDTAEMWLNEGFATYFDALYTEARDGQDAFLQRIRNFHRLYIDNIPFEGRFPLHDPRELFGATVYFKGASVLHMLRRVLGDEAFFALMRDWATLFAFGNVSTDDLRVLASSHHGESLDWFFDQWVYQRGHPELEVAWVDLGEESGERTAEILVRQAQVESPLFRLPLDVVVHTTAGDVEATLEVAQAVSRFRVTVPAEVTSVVFDPLSWQLMELDTVSPHLLLRAGAVGAGGGGLADVLQVGTPSGPSVGRPEDRRLDVRAGDPLDLLVLAPPGRTTARFVVYCIFEEAEGGHLTILPRGLGASVVPPPFAGGMPSVLFNNLGRRGIVGHPRLLAGPAPTLAHSKSAGLEPGDLTIFGLIQDEFSLSPLGLSLTNAIYLHTSP